MSKINLRSLKVGEYGILYYPNQFKIMVKVLRHEGERIRVQSVSDSKMGYECHQQFFFPKTVPIACNLYQQVGEDPLILHLAPEEYALIDENLMKGGDPPPLADCLHFFVYQNQVYCQELEPGEYIQQGKTLEEQMDSIPMKRTILLGAQKLEGQPDGNYRYLAILDCWYWFPLSPEQLMALNKQKSKSESDSNKHQKTQN